MIMTQDISIIRPDLIARIHALCEGEDDSIAIMATVSAELFHAVDGYDWVGFYRVVAPNLLKIGPYQGRHGCLAIPFDRGVCGAAARHKTTQLVDDVNRFEGHIACSSSTKSELVIPCFNKGGRLLTIMYLALSYDHRIIDGKESVSFLKMVKENLEDPRRLFLNI